MTWHEDPRWLRLVVAVLLAAVVVLTGLLVIEPEVPRARTVEVPTRACVRAAEAGKRVAKAAGTALYVAPDVAPLVRNALATDGDPAEVDNVLNHLGAVAPSLRRARAYLYSGDPPAWWRFEKWSARCLGEPAVPAYRPG